MLAGAGVVLATVLLRRPAHDPTVGAADSILTQVSDSGAQSPDTMSASPLPDLQLVRTTPSASAIPGSDMVASTPESPEEQHQAYVQARSSELMDLAMNDDPDSLRTILSELVNRDAEIRKTAVQASVQFGSRDAIPALADAATQTDDPRERVAIQEAIEFLKLPSLSEFAEQRKAADTGAPVLPSEANPSH